MPAIAAAGQPQGPPQKGMQDVSGARSWDYPLYRIGNVPLINDAIIDIFHQPPNPPPPAVLGGQSHEDQLLNRYMLDAVGDVDEKDHPAFNGIGGLANTPALIAKIKACLLPTPDASWLDWYCDVFTELDPGLVVHKALPTANDPADDLSTLDYQDKTFPLNMNDYDIESNSTGSDVVQRMATSTYRIRLRGFAKRAGYPVPIPGLVSFAGVKNPTPINPHRVWRSTSASVGGIPIFQASWELWYQLTVPPTSTDKYPQNPVAQIQPATDTIPKSVAVPEGVFGQPVQQEFSPKGVPLPIPIPKP